MNRSLSLGKLNSRSLCAFALATIAISCMMFAMINFKTETAAAAPGGIGIVSSKPVPASKPGKASRFGARTLKEGMSGPDVKVLKSIVRSKRLLKGAAVTETFDRPTTNAVQRFQRSASLRGNGVVNPSTAKAMVRSLGTSVSTWYGPGFFGNKTACGQTLRPNTIGVAHKTLPCGSKVLIGYGGKFVTVPVIDRGPFGAGRTWDVTSAVAGAIGIKSVGVATVRHAVINRGK